MPRQLLGAIAHQDVDPGRQLHALGGNWRTHHGQSVRDAGCHFPLRARAITQRRDGDSMAAEEGREVAHEPNDLHSAPRGKGLHLGRHVAAGDTQPGARLRIAGSHVTPEVQALAARRGVEVVGFVGDLAAFLGRHRVTVAPLRYGAGAKGKVAASIAHGLPVVCTPVAAEGMQLTPGIDVLVGDGAEELAGHVLALLNDDGLWHRLSEAGLAHARNVTSRASASARIRALLPGTP